MGILDEAIRDHLELKRQHGAEGDELKRLEDEAFGPPTRPGEPDFPESGTATAEPGAATNGELGPSTQEEEAAAAPASAEETPIAADSAPVAADEAPAQEASTQEEAAEHPLVADSSEAETTLYDHSLDEDLDFEELGLALDDDVDDEAGELPAEPEPAPAAEPPQPPPSPEAAEEPPIESLETVEHPLEPESGEHEAPSDEIVADEPASEELALEEPASEEYEREEPGSEEDDHEEPADHYDEEEEESEHREPESSEEDVLADTPEFLRDRPEDDELWFEQGEPKDFDFD